MARSKDVKKNKHQIKDDTDTTIVYAGFWSRFLALSVDVFMIGIPISLLIYFVFGYDTMQNQPGFIDGLKGVAPAEEGDPLIPILTMLLWSAITLLFWYKRSQTPGKKMAHVIIVDNKTYKKASFGQLSVRLLFFIMPVFAFISFFIMLFHPKKRTLHDIFSGTVVIYEPQA